MSEDLKILVAQALDLPAIPAVASKIVNALAHPNTTINDLSKLISTDPGLSARILKIANSAMFGCQRQIDSLSMAVNRIGFSSLKGIVVAVSTREIYQPFGEKEKLLWEHSVGVSIASQTLAQALGGFKSDEVFVGGLMHDIGKTLLNSKNPQKYGQVFQRVSEGGESFVDAEHDIYGFTHAEAGSLLISKWNLPETLTDVIRLHHDLDFKEEVPQGKLRVAALLNMADLICKKLAIGYPQHTNGANLSEAPSAGILEIGEEQLEDLIEKTENDYQENKGVFM